MIGVVIAFIAVAGIVAGSGVIPVHLAVMAIGWMGVSYLVARAVASEGDRSWLTSIMVAASVAKMAGAWARYYVLFSFYDGIGDAFGYHNDAIALAPAFRSFNVPAISSVGFGSPGTRLVSWLTGLIYAPFEPSVLGGFWIYAFIAFIGQTFLYLGFRKSMPTNKWKKYALLVFLWPSLLYWPSSIGKEALILLGLGLGVWGAASLYRRYQVRWLIPIAIAGWLISLVRIHVAALFVGSLLVAALVSKHSGGLDAMFRRTTILAVGVAAMIPLALALSAEFGVNLDSTFTTQELDPVFSDVGDTTGQGGSAVAGGVIRSPADIPAGVVKVLFRPLPNEASNTQTLAASLEGLMLLTLIVWRLPRIIANASNLRRSPFLVFCTIYTALFIWAWSAILNLGILARQRSLVIPLVLAIVVGIGWDQEESENPDLDGPGNLSGTTVPTKLAPYRLFEQQTTPNS